VRSAIHPGKRQTIRRASSRLGVVPNPAKSLAERFWEKVNKTGPIPSFAPELGRCWLWTGTAPNGYGQIRLGNASAGKAKSHRVAYEFVHGAIPEGMTIDHLCRVPLCVRVDHLEAVPQRINTLRGTSPPAQAVRSGMCGRGHRLEGANLAWRKDGRRRCRACSREQRRAYRARRPGQTDDRPECK
jgi:hypothetical protein